MVKRDLVESVMEVRRVSARIISMDIVVNEKVVTVISVYAPQSGRSEKEKEKFYEDLTAEVQSTRSVQISVGSCHHNLTEKLKMHRVAAKFVSRLMTSDQQAHRVQVCQDLLDHSENYKEF